MSNPLISKVKLPGRIFQLPSKGKFYSAGVFAEHVNEAEIQVKPLSALAEMKMRSPDLLFTGRAIREICEECIPDILKPEQLISKDVDAIFCFLRIVTYGPEMKITHTHRCETGLGKQHDYLINLDTIVGAPRNECLDHIDILYKMTLSTGQVVHLRPVTFKDALDLNHLQQELTRVAVDSGQTDHKALEKLVVTDLMSVIRGVEVEDEEHQLITDRALIDGWIRSLQKKHFDEIVESTKRCNEWGFNLTATLKCKDCEAEFQYNLELDPINFFSG
jgi:hypothetical protein